MGRLAGFRYREIVKQLKKLGLQFDRQARVHARVGRPRSESPKVFTGIRLDADVVDTFKATGKGWQTRMNAALRDWLKRHSPT